MAAPSLTVFSGVLERTDDRFLLRYGGLLAEPVLALRNKGEPVPTGRSD